MTQSTRATRPTPEPDLRIGVIGLRHGARHVRGWQQTPGSAVTALCDLAPDTARALAKEAAPHCTVTTSADELLADPAVDAVVVSVPNGLHADIARRALLAGKHVAVEKPIATSAEQASALVRLAEQRGLVLAVLHDFRADPAHWAARELVRRGDLGQVYFARTRWTRRDNAPTGWYRHKALAGGGVLLDLGTHRIDLALWTLGFPAVRSVSAATSRHLLERRDEPGDVEDTAVGMLHFDGGACLSVDTSFLGPLPRAEDVLLEVRGTKGSLRVANIGDSYRDYALTVFGEAGEEQPPAGAGLKAAPSIYADFVAAVRAGTAPLCPGWQAAAVADVIDRMYAAAAQNGDDHVRAS
ncbi:Gfo/Idh/MocA family protein [Kitasatospora sp. NPDC094019]|uniref:Gfo/Idh/MocA family protein n=1 Tax=Kitasatospora sp. NPDC094019 TaxID=3364091 RepID=UPI0037F6FE33